MIAPSFNTHRKSLLIVSFCLLSGCSSLGGYTDDKNDICYSWRSQLRQSEHYYAQSIIEGAAIGGAVGAGAGVIGALITGGDVGKGALIGGLTGLVAGGVGGYYNAKQKDIADQQALARSVRSDIMTANGEIDRTSIAFAGLRDCRFAAAQKVKNEFRTGRITKDQAMKQLDELRKLFDEDIKMAQELGMKMNERLTEYQEASNKILLQNPNARTYLDNERFNTQTVQQETVEYKPTKQKSSKSKTKHKKTQHSTTVASSTTTPKTQSAQQPQKTIPAKDDSNAPVAVQVAHVTETNQIKQKSFVDQVDQAKVQAKTAFNLEGSVSLLTPIQPTYLCER